MGDLRLRRSIVLGWVAGAALGVALAPTALGQAPPGPAVVATIRVGAGPAGVAVDPGTNTVIVANSQNYGDDSLTVIDAVRQVVVGRIPGVGSNVNADAVVFDPATRRFYVSAEGGEALAAVEARGRAIVGRVRTPAGRQGFLGGMAPHPGTGMLYAVDWSGSVYALDSRSLTLKATIPLPPPAREGLVSVHPDGHRLYVTYGDGFLVIDAGSRRIEATVPVPVSSVLAFDPGRGRLYGADGRNSLYAIDGASHRVVVAVRVGDGGGAPGRGLALNPATGRAFVANAPDGTVSVVDVGSGTLLATVAVGRWPNRIAVNPSTNRVYVTNRDDGTLSVIEDR